jgi:hypothetical protein
MTLTGGTSLKTKNFTAHYIVVDDVFVKTTSDRAVMGIFGHLSEFID